MSIEFNDENQQQALYNQYVQASSATGFAKWFIDKGFAKDDASANIIMIGLSLLSFGAAAGVIFFFIL